MRFDQQTINKCKELLEGEGRKIVIVPHVNADGDAMGSCLALQRVLKKAGHRPMIVSETDYPEYLKWVEGSSEVVISEWDQKLSQHLLSGAELFFFLDFNDIKRIGNSYPAIEKNEAPRIMIDHHPYPTECADAILSDTTASSTCELMFNFIEEVGLREHMDQCAAESLFMGILTDTGAFSHNSSNPQTYQVVGELMKYNVNKDYIHTKIFHQQSKNRMKLLGYAINDKLNYLDKYHTAIITLSKEELERFEFQSGDTEGIVNFPLSIKGTVLSVFFSEKDGMIKISFRSKGNFPANQIAEKYFNGGGHTNAAGGRLDNLTLDQAVEKLISVLPEFEEKAIEESSLLK